MENRVVCFYCGTVYNAEDEKCPLCGGKDHIKEEEAERPVQRRRLTEQERRERRRAASRGGKFAAKKSEAPAKNDTTKTMLIAALIFLVLAVVAMTWFIGDMIGWWGGLEDKIERDDAIGAADILDEKCTLLEISDTVVHLESVGQTAELKLTVNLGCREEISITFPDAAIVTAVSNTETEKNSENKTDTWELTAVSEGQTAFSFSCGELSASCLIVVGEYDEVPEDTTAIPSETTEPTEPDEDYEPELNFTGDISLYQRGETVPLRIVNLPNGASVTWHSADETVAKVDENGLLTAVGGGSTTVTAEVFGKTVEILVRCPFDQSGNVGAHLEYTDVTIKVGESFNLYLLDSDGYRITDVTYEMSDEGICSIKDGKVTGLTGGDYVTITVTYNTQEFKCVVRVRW